MNYGKYLNIWGLLDFYGHHFHAPRILQNKLCYKWHESLSMFEDEDEENDKDISQEGTG